MRENICCTTCGRDRRANVNVHGTKASRVRRCTGAKIGHTCASVPLSANVFAQLITTNGSRSRKPVQIRRGPPLSEALRHSLVSAQTRLAQRNTHWRLRWEGRAIPPQARRPARSFPLQILEGGLRGRTHRPRMFSRMGYAYRPRPLSLLESGRVFCFSALRVC